LDPGAWVDDLSSALDLAADLLFPGNFCFLINIFFFSNLPNNQILFKIFRRIRSHDELVLRLKSKALRDFIHDKLKKK